MASCGSPHTDPKLSEIFDDVWRIYEKVENSKESTNSDTLQTSISRAIQKCEAAIQMVSMLSLFSTNEDIEEVATNELKYMLLSALIGVFTMKKSSNASTRLTIVNKAKAHYEDYLRLCRHYNLTDYQIFDTPTADRVTQPSHSTTSSQSSDITQMANVRARKIEEYKQTRLNEQKLSELHEAVNREHVDDEVKRSYYIALMQKFIAISIDDLDSIKTELEILQFMESKEPQPKPPKQPNTSTFTQPFILTKNQVQKQVFGTGYPSLPTMTVEEFYEQKLKDGKGPQTTSNSLQDKAMNPQNNEKSKEDEKAMEDFKTDKDDPETLKHQRAMDDWKDEHRRGEGNRQNMG